jgi:hypothetical protein
MRYEDWRTPPIEDKRPLGQRFTVMPIDGYLHPAMNPPGAVQQVLNAQAAGMGSDLPTGPVAPSDYRPRSVYGPDRPAAQQMSGEEYRPGGPEASPQYLMARPNPSFQLEPRMLDEHAPMEDENQYSRMPELRIEGNRSRMPDLDPSGPRPWEDQQQRLQLLRSLYGR